MTDILQYVMDMAGNTGAFSVTSGLAMIGFGILFVFGAVNCVLGYRLLRFWMMLFGFLIGAGLGFGAAYSMNITEKYMYAVFAVGAGVILAVIAFLSYKIGVFILGMGIGMGLGIYLIHPTTSLTFFFCLMAGVGLGVLAMKKARVILIAGTSLLGGITAGLSLAKLMNLEDIPYGIGFSAGFVLLGMLIQFATNRPKRARRNEEDYDDDYEEDEEAAEFDRTVVYRPEREKRGQTPTETLHRNTARPSGGYYEEPIDEELLDEEVVKEMMDEDDREGEELWKKITGREKRQNRNRKQSRQKREE